MSTAGCLFEELKMALLEGKSAFVTGGARGIGRAVCIALAREGADIAFNYVSNDRAASELMAEVKRLGRQCDAYKVSVDDADAVRGMFRQAAERLGGLDVLVNNAGIKRDGFMLMMSDAHWDDVIAVNLKGVFNCCREAAKIMMRKKIGSIINMSSLSGVMGQPGQVNYAASKGGILALTKSAAKELAGYGIRVNAIAPGFIETDMLSGVPENILEANRERIALRRWGQADEVAKVAVFLASDWSSYITGDVLNVNGGLYM
jgi:3-oxoacyl-[acyl-carrier protein] reductase